MPGRHEQAVDCRQHQDERVLCGGGQVGVDFARAREGVPGTTHHVEDVRELRGKYCNKFAAVVQVCTDGTACVGLKNALHRQGHDRAAEKWRRRKSLVRDSHEHGRGLDE